ncbi:Mur ligase family protein [Ruania albidiflava]|uniref:Mur ligase family protein n=1 Tax=Ruania albidiflava TaxID=366586 RepID=UPI0003B5ED63|nr:Mur ligase family protein [Ruania albidiflava]
MSTSGARLQLHRRRAYRYLMPLKRPYGTARALITESTNFIVHLYGSHNGAAVEGVGESQPRHELTGDGAPDNRSAWAFLHSALVALEGAELDLTTRTTAVDGVRTVMADLDRLAQREAEEVHGPKPFRGTLLGVEVALLDLAARAMGLRISQLLTERRSRARISIATISTTATLSEIGDRAARQKRFPITRLKGDGSLEHNLALLRAAATGNAAAGRPKPLWIDINEAMDLDAASEFVRAAAAQMAAGELPAELIVEGPLPQEDGVQHADLQRVADQAVADLDAEQDLRLQIMADENIWDAGDLSELQARGGCRAINIKAPKAGGLLPSLDLAEAAVAADPQLRLCIGGMLGTSELTAWALHNLGKSMPRIDYMTTVPPRNVAATIADPPSRYSAAGSNVIALQHEPGLGTRLLPEVLAPFVQDEHDLDDPAHHPVGSPAATDVSGLDLATLPDLFGGRWLTAPRPERRAGGGTFLVNDIEPGQVVFTMETGGWADSLRRRAGQSPLTTEEVAGRAATAGAAAVVTSAPTLRADLPVLTVDDPRRALWAFGAHARQQYPNPVVAVTGTAGKSTTTDMLQHVLSGTDRVHSPTGNWNTIDGVSLTLAGLLQPSDIAVLEMAHVGFVGFGNWSTPEMARPDIAVVTSIGQAHADLDATLEGTARLKARIFRGLHGQGVAVLNMDTPHSDLLLAEATAHAGRVISYGRHPEATLRLVGYEPATGHVRARRGTEEIALRLGVRGEHNALNALAVLAVLHALGRSEQDYLERFAEIRPLKGRGQVKKTRLDDRRLTIVDQSYNANPASMRATLRDFGERFQRSRRVLVLGDMLELGTDAEQLHTDLLDAVLGVRPDRVYLVGEHYSGLWERLPTQLRGARVPAAEDMDVHLRQDLRNGDVLFVKSSHGVGLHRLVKRLQRGELHVPTSTGDATSAGQRPAVRPADAAASVPSDEGGGAALGFWSRLRRRWTAHRHEG